MLASLVVLACGMAGVGWWVSQQIQAGVIQETAATTALYMNSFVAPLGRKVTTVKIWTRDGRIVYSTNPVRIGGTFQIQSEIGQGTHVIAGLPVDIVVSEDAR